MKCFVASEEQSVEILNKYPNKKFFLVAKHPKSYLYLLEHGIKMDSVNVGGIYFKEGRKQYTNTVYLDEETKDIILKSMTREFILMAELLHRTLNWI